MKIKKILFVILFIILFLFICDNKCFAKELDQINKYYVTVDPRKDGTLDMVYHIEWKVLDSTKEGPLSWVKIGIPNSNVDSIKSLSNTIKSIKYYESSGSYVRIDFKKEYYADEVVTFDFSIHQKYMYQLDSSYCNYSFTPGWFPDIEIKDMKVYWNSNNIYSSSAKETNSDGYLVWSARLGKGAKLKTKVVYPKSAFSKLDENAQSSYAQDNYSQNSAKSTMNTFMFFIFAIMILYIILGFMGIGYNSHRGYGYGYNNYGYRRHHSHYHHSSCATSHSCVSSCACACACAGGGRAGCSKKDLYGTNLRSKNIKKIL